jgi:hypothetical protein
MDAGIDLYTCPTHQEIIGESRVFEIVHNARENGGKSCNMSRETFNATPSQQDVHEASNVGAVRRVVVWVLA